MVEPRISDLLVPLEVAKTSSLSRAARNLGTSPVKVLNIVNALEAYFKTKIFERSRRGMTLTPEGEEVVEAARSAVAMLSRLTMKEAAHGNRPAGIVWVAASRIAGDHVLPCLVSNFKANNPSIGFNIEILEPPQIMERLEGGKVDVASYTKPYNAEWWRGEVEVAKDRLVVVTPPGHSLAGRVGVALRRMLRYPLILYDSGCEAGNLLDEFLRLNGVNAEGLNVKMVMPDVPSLITAVSEGLGLGFCPELLAKKAERAGLVGVVHPSNAEGDAYSIRALKSERAKGDAPSEFWRFLAAASKRFKGSLPCMLKVVYP